MLKWFCFSSFFVRWLFFSRGHPLHVFHLWGVLNMRYYFCCLCYFWYCYMCFFYLCFVPVLFSFVFFLFFLFALSFLFVLCCYLLSISCILNIGLLGSMTSFMCRLFLYNLCLWYFSSVFMCFRFLRVCFYDVHGVCYGSVLMSCVCMRFEYPELPLLFFTANMCSFYMVWNALPVWPMYFSW
jgi:hypothetical protein